MKKILILIFMALAGAAGFLSVFGVAGAQTINPGGPIQPCYSFNANVGRGAATQVVFNLQTILIKENLLHISAPTGYFGNLTFNATVAFQAKYGILQTGFVGQLTRAKLNSLYHCGQPSNPIAGPGQNCGGNINNPPVCQAGYYCAPVPGSNLAFGDVGGTCVINPTNSQSPIISGVSGPTTLNTNQTGTWTVDASDPQNGTLNYSVIWGDESTYPALSANGASSLTYTQTASFTHSYSGAGNYNPTFYVKNSSGGTSTVSISVNVTNGNGNQPVISYLQPNSGIVGSTATITGSGFTSTGNRIVFGNLNTENDPSYNLNSYNGTSISFTVPYTQYYYCPPNQICNTPAELLTGPGIYEVSVINSNGTSNQVPFTVVSQTACTPNWQCGWTTCTNGSQIMAPVDTNNCGQPYQGNPPIACPDLARQCN